MAATTQIIQSKISITPRLSPYIGVPSLASFILFPGTAIFKHRVLSLLTCYLQCCTTTWKLLFAKLLCHTFRMTSVSEMTNVAFENPINSPRITQQRPLWAGRNKHANSLRSNQALSRSQAFTIKFVPIMTAPRICSGGSVKGISGSRLMYQQIKCWPA